MVQDTLQNHMVGGHLGAIFIHDEKYMVACFEGRKYTHHEYW
jgi:hypothetical protein